MAQAFDARRMAEAVAEVQEAATASSNHILGFANDITNGRISTSCHCSVMRISKKIEIRKAYLESFLQRFYSVA